MVFNHLTSRPQSWPSRQAPASAKAERSGKNKLSRRLSVLVIIGLSFVSWGAIWEGTNALVRSQPSYTPNSARSAGSRATDQTRIPGTAGAMAPANGP